jgi:acid phosphatase type 7
VSKPRYLVAMALLSPSLLVCWIGGAKEVRAAADPVLVGAGDIASCTGSGDEATAALLANTRGTVVTLGDNAYPDGTAAQFRDCYGPSWGLHKARTKPAAGNHEYHTEGAAGYFGYFGAAAGDPDKGYYSYDKGRWHIVVLNSNCSEVGGCTAGSPQGRWLKHDLVANAKRCTLAYWHAPRFSSSRYGNNAFVKPFWKALYKAGAEVVLNGHAHHYERFAPQRPDGTLARKRGIREFVVGTGGVNHYPFEAVKPNSRIRDADAFGVLRLTLHRGSYDWKFKPVAGKTFTDSGTNNCH